MKVMRPAAQPSDRPRRGLVVAGVAAGALGALLASHAAAMPPLQKTSAHRDLARAGESYWRERERGWFWYDDPPREPIENAKPKPKAVPAPGAPAVPSKVPELIEFEALQRRIEELRNIAIINPSERNVRNYLDIQNRVIDKASTFADVAQRVLWATPELDPTVMSRPVNAKALEVFDREQARSRTHAVARLSDSHALLFFFRSDCPYCHQFAPLLKEFEARFGLQVVAISVDGQALPAFPHPRVDNGITRALDVRQVPALFLADPRGGKITALGYGVLSESELLERIHTVTQPGAEELAPSTTRHLPHLSLR